MQRITPFVWFDTQAEEAAKFYMLKMVKFNIKKLKEAYAGK
jgi:predicted 3-demethylubiquinone-9 3-methyltransferase (glyoxalase superfamily)